MSAIWGIRSIVVNASGHLIQAGRVNHASRIATNQPGNPLDYVNEGCARASSREPVELSIIEAHVEMGMNDLPRMEFAHTGNAYTRGKNAADRIFRYLEVLMSKASIDTPPAYDVYGKLPFMVRCGGNVMVKRPRCVPFVRTEKEWRTLPKVSSEVREPGGN